MSYTIPSLTFIFKAMHHLIEINQKIAELQKQAEDLKISEREAVVADINAKINAFGLVATELAFPVKQRKVRASKEAKPQKPAKSKNPVPAKYKGPHGELWSGRGLQPRWLTQAINAGQDRASFFVGASK